MDNYIIQNKFNIIDLKSDILFHPSDDELEIIVNDYLIALEKSTNNDEKSQLPLMPCPSIDWQKRGLGVIKNSKGRYHCYYTKTFQETSYEYFYYHSKDGNVYDIRTINGRFICANNMKDYEKHFFTHDDN